MNKKGYGNSKAFSKVALVNSLASILVKDDVLANRCKFNFHYFCKDELSQNFAEWNHLQLVKLLDKLKAYSENSLEHWTKQNLNGGVGHVLEIYKNFPTEQYTQFIAPKVVPIHGNSSLIFT